MPPCTASALCRFAPQQNFARDARCAVMPALRERQLCIDTEDAAEHAAGQSQQQQHRQKAPAAENTGGGIPDCRQQKRRSKAVLPAVPACGFAGAVSGEQTSAEQRQHRNDMITGKRQIGSGQQRRSPEHSEHGNRYAA